MFKSSNAEKAITPAKPLPDKLVREELKAFDETPWRKRNLLCGVFGHKPAGPHSSNEHVYWCDRCGLTTWIEYSTFSIMVTWPKD